MNERFDEKQYVQQVVKMLKCSKEQKEEIRRQLEADIRDARERNESDAEIKQSLGSPVAMAEIATSEMQPYLTEEKMEEAKKTIGDDWGTFRNLGKTYMTEIRQNGQSFAMVQMNASYDNVSVTYTLTFDAEMKLAGIYMK